MRLLFFLLFPALELYLLVWAGSVIGALNIVLWVFVSAAIGLAAARAQGQSAMLKARAELAEGRVPPNTFMDGLLLFLGGVLLILPGLITDAVGLFLLIPPFRHFAARAINRYLVAQQAKGGSARFFIFRSGPGSGGGFGPRGGFDAASFQRGGHSEGPDSGVFDTEAQKPRQAAVLESRTIDDTDSAESGDRKPDEGSDRKE